MVLSLAWPYYVLRGDVPPWPSTALAIGTVALLISSLTRQVWWWRLIHTLFAPLAWAVLRLGIPPGWYLLAFMALLLVYRGAIGGQIPLYFSNQTTVDALAARLVQQPGQRFLDLGAGIGSVLRPLARAVPEARLTGIENAPATWLLGYLRTLGRKNCQWLWGDIRRISLADYDMVYAFLSPAPMAALWEKVKSEMPPGSLFVSNSFAVPGVEADETVTLSDSRQTQLYCYRI